MELRHLRYFTTIAQTLNFSKAARLLHIAQPPLSAQIKSLEGELGVQLFERSSKGVTLTKAGRHFLPKAHEVLRAAKQAGDAASWLSEGKTGELRLGLISPAATTKLAGQLRRFHRQNPGVAFHVRQEDAATLQSLLDAEELDIIVTRPLSVRPDQGQQILEAHELLLALPEQHPLTKQKAISWRRVAGERVLLINPAFNPHYGQTFLRGCTQHGVHPEIDYSASDLPTLIWLVSAGLGVCPYPSSLVPTAPEGVVFRPFTPKVEKMKLAMVWKIQRESPIVRSFLATVGDKTAWEKDAL